MERLKNLLIGYHGYVLQNSLALGHETHQLHLHSHIPLPLHPATLQGETPGPWSLTWFDNIHLLLVFCAKWTNNSICQQDFSTFSWCCWFLTFLQLALQKVHLICTQQTDLTRREFLSPCQHLAALHSVEQMSFYFKAENAFNLQSKCTAKGQHLCFTIRPSLLSAGKGIPFEIRQYEGILHNCNYFISQVFT